MKQLTFIFTILLSSFALAARPDSELEQMTMHLEFLGYKCTQKQGDSGPSLSCKTKQTVPDIHIQPKLGGYLFSFYRLATEDGKKKEHEMLVILNRMNQGAIAARFYRDKDGDMSMEAFFPGEYNKQAFSNLLQEFNDDWKRLVKENEDELGKLLEL